MKVAVEYAILPKDGERVSGDAAFVRAGEDGCLFAVIDALGHGEHAAAAARVALEALAESPQGEDFRAVIDRLHARLRGTRGAAGMICRFREGRLQGCGVGNVELLSHGTRVQWLQSPGILGGSLGKIRIFDAQLAPGDRLALVSDGVSPRFDLSLFRGVKAAEVCRTLMNRHRRSHDDSTVLIADIEP
ncbi:SpoIIE family protein phosphatase [Sorangium cellulosum]|uniref:Phosphoserine phosphatase n=1 Tax=Sorangium cellulosum TaxID=56 RepID=A0A150QTR6_SORCE|nr:SpoIIE family protein phosphatase [Sorangium cellulosum]KYF71411.1 phosphoserine phosphatase [Sorangium cellulosum]